MSSKILHIYELNMRRWQNKYFAYTSLKEMINTPNFVCFKIHKSIDKTNILMSLEKYHIQPRVIPN